MVGDDEDLIEAYKFAASAYEEKRFEELLDVAADINLHMSNPDPILIEDVNKRYEFYVKRLAEIKNSSMWQWGNATPEAKENLLKLLVGQRAKKKLESN